MEGKVIDIDGQRYGERIGAADPEEDAAEEFQK